MEQTRDHREQEGEQGEQEAAHQPDTLEKQLGKFIEEKELQHMQGAKKEKSKRMKRRTTNTHRAHSKGK